MLNLFFHKKTVDFNAYSYSDMFNLGFSIFGHSYGGHLEFWKCHKVELPVLLPGTQAWLYGPFQKKSAFYKKNPGLAYILSNTLGLLDIFCEPVYGSHDLDTVKVLHKQLMQIHRSTIFISSWNVVFLLW